MMREPIGTFSPASPSGYPCPSIRSWLKRISGAVFRQSRRGQHDPLPDRGVTAHELRLLLVEWLGLVEDLGRDRGFAGMRPQDDSAPAGTRARGRHRETAGPRLYKSEATPPGAPARSCQRPLSCPLSFPARTVPGEDPNAATGARIAAPACSTTCACCSIRSASWPKIADAER
jgi:hypothetical protein